MEEKAWLGLKEISKKKKWSQMTTCRYADQGMPFEYAFKGTRKVMKFNEEDVDKWIQSQREGK